MEKRPYTVGCIYGKRIDDPERVVGCVATRSDGTVSDLERSNDGRELEFNAVFRTRGQHKDFERRLHDQGYKIGRANGVGTDTYRTPKRTLPNMEESLPGENKYTRAVAA